MNTIVGYICADAAALLRSDPYNLFLGFAILGCVVGVIIKMFRFRV